MQKPIAILSSTVLSHDGTYQYAALPSMPADLAGGIPHYVGHPATRYLLDQAGAIYTPGYFTGLEVGQTYLVAQLKDPRKGGAFTTDVPGVEPSDLKWGMVRRVA